MVPMKLTLPPWELEEVRERMRTGEPRVIRRAIILHSLHLGYTSGDISKILHVSPTTVTNVGHAYSEGGLEHALVDEQRPGRPPKFDEKERQRIVALVCSAPPIGFDRWTLDLIVEEAQKRGLVSGPISRETVRVILQEHALKPWQRKEWCIAEIDEEYARRMEDVLDVYQLPYNPARPVVCLDEKPVPLIHEKVAPLLPRGPGDVLLKDYEYVRGGSANVFCAVEPKAGVYINKVTSSRDGLEFSIFASELAARYPHAEKILLVMDNLSTHTLNVLKEHLGERLGAEVWDRFEIHHTPVHGSWLNQAELAIGIYARQCLGDGRVGDLENLKKETAAWNKKANERGVEINWTFTKAKARKKLKYNPPGETLSKINLLAA